MLRSLQRGLQGTAGAPLHGEQHKPRAELGSPLTVLLQHGGDSSGNADLVTAVLWIPETEDSCCKAVQRLEPGDVLLGGNLAGLLLLPLLLLDLMLHVDVAEQAKKSPGGLRREEVQDSEFVTKL